MCVCLCVCVCVLVCVCVCVSVCCACLCVCVCVCACLCVLCVRVCVRVCTQLVKAMLVFYCTTGGVTRVSPERAGTVTRAGTPFLAANMDDGVRPVCRIVFCSGACTARSLHNVSTLQLLCSNSHE